MNKRREKLISTRKKEGMTLQEVADKVGISKPYYWQIEQGKRGLSYEMAVKIARVFNKRPDDIFLVGELTYEEQKEGVK
ncbi:repressor protein [Geobacillus phage GBSV1]|uniref:Repressor protein n=1 Tax=Geobacillus phage GBSV1 TaxID=365048 RepID=Q0H243_9CAUD|nr:helix-turn-helix transcriptional regulator [Geobacillus sp. C56-T3]YP_764505.1 transcriptional regulator [Geobacillus phage GBSV1]ABC61305.1 repressor protein [Geobacillus phage GBSV1]ADI25303.1 transcriptional regulator, XRE family [Geobacillus sp. C56-T3]